MSTVLRLSFFNKLRDKLSVINPRQERSSIKQKYLLSVAHKAPEREFIWVFPITGQTSSSFHSYRNLPSMEPFLQNQYLEVSIYCVTCLNFLEVEKPNTNRFVVGVLLRFLFSYLENVNHFRLIKLIPLSNTFGLL